MSALDFTARALALRAAAHIPLTFADFCQLPLPASVARIETSGHAEPGWGGGSYVPDAYADAALQATHPAAVFAGSDGRFFRLVAGESGFVTPEQFGCPPWAPGVNQQPFIQAAIRYAERFGYGVAFPQRIYELWAPNRSVNSQQIQGVEDGNGHPICIRRRVEFRAAVGGTTFHRKSPLGNDPAIYANWLAESAIDDGFTSMPVWRGGMFAFVGQDPQPDDTDELAAIVFRGKWVIDGGIPRSDAPGIHYATSYPDFMLDAQGRGWDIYDKALWAESNKYAGIIEFDDLTITGFRGELYYPTYRHGGIKGGRLTLTETDGDGFNPSMGFDETVPLDIEHLTIRRAAFALEGSTGWKGRIGTLDIADCTNGGNISPGTWPGAPGEGSETPTLTIGRLIVARTPEDGGTNMVALGRNTKVGEAIMTDCGLRIGMAGADPVTGCEIGRVTVRADRANVANGVIFYEEDNVAGSKPMHSNRVGTVVCERTPAAIAGGFAVATPVSWSGSLGDNNFVARVEGYAVNLPRALVTPVPDFHVGFGDLSGVRTQNSTGASHNVESAATIVANSPVVALTTTTSGFIGTANLPSSPAGKLPKGAVLSVRNASSAPLAVGTGWTAMTRRLVHLPGSTLNFRTNGSFWEPLGERPVLAASTAAGVLSKNGADIPAGDVSSELVFTIAGARPGMSVQVTTAAAVSGDALLVGRVVGNDTVGIRARNLNLGGALALPTAIYRVELDWAS